MSDQQYNIRFTGIEIVSKSISEPPLDLQPKENFNYNFWIDLKVEESKNIIGILTDVTISLMRSNREVGHFKVLSIFELLDFKEVIKKKESIYIVPIELEIVTKSIGLSTTRGIMAAEAMGTYLQGTILPLIDMNALIRDQHEKALNNPAG